MQKRGQAAIEFLTTYGWAILIILIVVGAIYSLNLFSPKVINKCDSVSPISCADIKIDTSNTVSLLLSASDVSNKPGLKPNIVSVTLTTPEGYTCNPPTNAIPLDRNILISCTLQGNSLKEGRKFSGVALAQYVSQDTENLVPPLKHNVEITFSGTVETQVGI
ncbi:MAG: hypothetical protein AABW56_02760 [Nanoarchaeota archaeon]